MNTVTEILRELEQSRFYGTLEIKFEGGSVVLVRKTQTLKPEPDHRNNRGKDNEQAY